MMTTTPTATALKRTHAALMHELHHLEQAVAPETATSVDDLFKRLTTTLTQVMEHFRIKEHNGYLNEVQALEPRWEIPVRDLREEHRMLRQKLHGLILEAAAAKHIDEAFRARVRAWIDQVHQHHRQENQILQEALDVDISDERN